MTAPSSVESGTSHPVEHEDEAAVRVLGWVETATDLTRALGDLAPRQRAVLVFRYLYDLSEAQVAEVMGCSVGTVKSTTSRALQRLRVAADEPESSTTEKPEGSISTMKTELEAEVREAFAARAGRLPVGAASRPAGDRLRTAGAPPARAGDRHRRSGGCRHDRRRPSPSCSVAAAPAYAGWSATPVTTATPSPAADASCQSQLSELAVGARRRLPRLRAWQNVLTDVRGPFTVALFQNDGAYAACFTSPSFTEINQVSASSGSSAASGSTSVRGQAGGGSSPASGLSSTLVGGTSSGDLQHVTQTHLSTSGDGPYTLVEGRTASGVTGVTLVRDDGQDVVATVDDGWLVAWWPGSATATSAQVSTQSGTTNEALVSGAPQSAPASASTGIVHFEREQRRLVLGVLGRPRRSCGSSGGGISGNSGNTGSSGNSGG